MKIAIDAFRVVCEPQTSGAVYVVELAAALSESPQVQAVYLVVPRGHEPAGGLPRFASAKVQWLVAPSRSDPSKGFHRQLWWVQRSFPATVQAQVGGVDWLIAPYHQTPMRVPRSCKVLTVIHDLCGLRADCGYRKLGRGYWRHFTNFLTATVRADAVIAISEYTRTELQRIFPSVKGRPTCVAYNAVTAKRLSATEAIEATAHLSLPQEYFLAYAAGGPRKGTDITLQSFAAYRRQGGRVRLVLIGGRSAIAEWRPVADSLNLDDVMWVSGVSDLVRDALYARAQALLFPSRCEGFGYPIVEAMRQGCPVAADQQSPAAEIMGSAQPLMATLSVEAVQREMRAFERLTTPQRAELAERLVAESHKYSGKALASAYLSLMCAPQPASDGFAPLP
jgi:glycosyltransferase involved in cell wall biosynthesis